MARCGAFEAPLSTELQIEMRPHFHSSQFRSLSIESKFGVWGGNATFDFEAPIENVSVVRLYLSS